MSKEAAERSEMRTKQAAEPGRKRKRKMEKTVDQGGKKTRRRREPRETEIGQGLSGLLPCARIAQNNELEGVT